MNAFIERLRTVWLSQNLARRFLLASTAVFLVSMLIVGAWVARRIEDSVTRNTAIATAHYFESFVSPLVQGLATSETLDADKRQALDELMRGTSLGQRVVSFKIWRRGGYIAHASRTELAGQRFPETPKLKSAWLGEIAAGLDHLDEEENAGERQTGGSLLEIYVPLHPLDSEQMIAVGEFYVRAEKLKSDIFEAKLESWLVLGGITLVAVTSLLGMVRGASRTIDDQRASLQQRVIQLSQLLRQNQDLRERVERSSERASEMNEKFLRRLGSELHDGPAQLIGLALLRLDAPMGKGGDGGAQGGLPAAELRTVLGALRDALGEIRTISAGLSLPLLEQLTVRQTLEAAVRGHIQRTSTEVATLIAGLEMDAPHGVKATAFRFAQEALNNATRHAGAAGQTVEARLDRESIVIEVSDTGPGIGAGSSEGRLGLAGLRDRIESMGGTFQVISGDGRGTRLRALLPLQLGGSGAQV